MMPAVCPVWGAWAVWDINPENIRIAQKEELIKSSSFLIINFKKLRQNMPYEILCFFIFKGQLGIIFFIKFRFLV